MPARSICQKVIKQNIVQFIDLNLLINLPSISIEQVILALLAVFAAVASAQYYYAGYYPAYTYGYAYPAYTYAYPAYYYKKWEDSIGLVSA